MARPNIKMVETIIERFNAHRCKQVRKSYKKKQLKKIESEQKEIIKSVEIYENNSPIEQIISELKNEIKNLQKVINEKQIAIQVLEKKIDKNSLKVCRY